MARLGGGFQCTGAGKQNRAYKAFRLYVEMQSAAALLKVGTRFAMLDYLTKSRNAIVCIFVLACACVPFSDTLRLGDSEPVVFNGKRPQSYPIHGVDVARFTPPVDWRRARQAGIRFAFIKATEGGDLSDPMYRDHWAGAKRAGVAVGAYHFYYFCTKPETQARWFIRNVPRTSGALPPVLDLEWNPFSPTCQRRPPAHIVRAEIKTWLEIVERHYGQRPLVYTTPDFYQENALGLLQSEEFWLRSVAQTPDKIYPGERWTFWQYSGTGRVPGGVGDIDLNVFAGTERQWEAWRARRQLR